MTKIFLMRHGFRMDDPRNPEGKILPTGRPLDPDISAIGVGQAAETAELLKNEGLHLIYASPFLRTVHTAAVIAEKLNLKIRLEWGVGEHFVPQSF